MLSAIYEFPLIRDGGGGPPSLFESWEISDDLLTWTFKLRPDEVQRAVRRSTRP